MLECAIQQGHVAEKRFMEVKLLRATLAVLEMDWNYRTELLEKEREEAAGLRRKMQFF